MPTTENQSSGTAYVALTDKIAFCEYPDISQQSAAQSATKKTRFIE